MCSIRFTMPLLHQFTAHPETVMLLFLQIVFLFVFAPCALLSQAQGQGGQGGCGSRNCLPVFAAESGLL